MRERDQFLRNAETKPTIHLSDSAVCFNAFPPKKKNYLVLRREWLHIKLI